MAFPSLIGTVPLTLADGWTQARQIAGAIKQTSQNIVALAQAGNVSAQIIVNFSGQLAAQNAQLTTIAGLSGIAAYAQAQIGNASENVAQDFSTMQSAVTATIAWIVANFPTDSSGYLQLATLPASGILTYASFTPAQLSGFVTVLQALIATIN